MYLYFNLQKTYNHFHLTILTRTSGLWVGGEDAANRKRELYLLPPSLLFALPLSTAFVKRCTGGTDLGVAALRILIPAAVAASFLILICS